MYSYVQEDYLAPRVRTFRRRFRGHSPKLDAVVEEEVKTSEVEEENRVERKEEDEKWEEEEGDEGKWEEEDEEEGCGGKWKEEEGDERKEEEQEEERKGMLLAIPTCSRSSMAVEAGVKEISILGKRSHDLIVHEDAYDDHISMSSHKCHTHPASSCQVSAAHGLNEALGNSSPTLAAREPLQQFGDLGSKMRRSGDVCHVTGKKSADVCTLEEDSFKLHPRQYSHQGSANSNDSIPSASFSSVEAASPRENALSEKSGEGSLNYVGHYTK